VTHDVEERLRRSLAARSGDVSPDPAVWEQVQTRLRRRAYARWSVAGVAAAAMLAVAALLLPGLLTTSRVDLGPAAPGQLSGRAHGLVSTDGRSFTVADPAGEVVHEFDPPTDATEPLPITRLAVRPGSTLADLTVVYLRADSDCTRTEVGWVTAEAGSLAGGALGGGQGLCVTDPVWSPDGGALAWVEQASGAHADTFGLRMRCWGEDACEEFGDDVSPLHTLDVSGLEAAPGAVRRLRATDWIHDDAAMTLPMSVLHEPGGVRAAALQVVRSEGGGVAPPGLLEGHGASVSASPAGAAPDDGRPLGWVGGHTLVVEPGGDVVLRRAGEPATLPLPSDVLDAGQADSGDAWLSAREDTVVLGDGGDAWTVRWTGDGWSELTPLPGVVHAAVLPLPVDAPTPDETPTPASDPTAEPAPSDGTPPDAAGDVSFLATDGAAITLHGPQGPTTLVTASQEEITDFAVHPASTADDLTVAWREGTGCDATLHWARVHQGTEAARDTRPATCPGRLVFAPDGSHLAWVSHGEDPASGMFVLETLPWWTGPYAEPEAFTLRADPAETAGLDLTDWVWGGGTGPETDGVLLLAGFDTHGTVSAYSLGIMRLDDRYPGDPRLALADDAVARQVTPFRSGTGQDRFAVLQVDSHHNDGAAVGPAYVLEQRPRGGGEVEVAVAREGDGDQRDEGPVLPEGLLRVNTTGEVDDVWMTARGDEVLLGDGAGRAWRLTWTDTGWIGPRELDGDVRFAVPFGRRDPPSPSS